MFLTLVNICVYILFFNCLHSNFYFYTSEQSKSYHLKQTLIIQSSNSWNKESIKDILIDPRFLITDKDGNIYIVDKAVMCIKVFNRNGHCIMSIGGNGNGPGEFQDITTVAINLNNELVVFDYMNRRFSVFDSNGNVLNSHNCPDIPIQWPRRMICLPDSNYILLAKSYRNDYMIHYFSKHFNYLKSTGKLPITNIKDKSIEKMFVGLLTGEIVSDSEGVIYYAPGFYNGKIYVYKDGILESILKSKKSIKKSFDYIYSKNQIPKQKKEKFQLSLSSRYGYYSLRRYYISGGLTVLSDGTIANLLISTSIAENEIGIELFSPNSSQYYYFNLKMDDMPINKWLSSSNNKWYLIDQREEIPIIKEYLLEELK